MRLLFFKKSLRLARPAIKRNWIVSASRHLPSGDLARGILAPYLNAQAG